MPLLSINILFAQGIAAASVNKYKPAKSFETTQISGTILKAADYLAILRFIKESF
ncbi:hypothetical protein [Pontibacter rugosus]|uniref:Uncharacterized protein n=1 Tax=Pontibacter rugosus TaxID=1745966 RepID=A0ABW3SUD4_9BACT